MGFRKLRIAWSVGCGIACVLMIVLWPLSYRWTSAPLLWHMHIEPDTTLFVNLLGGGIGVSLMHFHGNGAPEDTGIAAPFWLLVSVAVALSLSPWIRWRFRLGTLIIAMTLVAAVIGSIVYLLRN